MARSEDMKTPLARIAFANSLFKPQERDNGKKQWVGLFAAVPERDRPEGRNADRP